MNLQIKFKPTDRQKLLLRKNKRSFILSYLFFAFVFYPSIIFAFQASNQSNNSESDSVKTSIINFETEADTVYIYLNDNYDHLIILTEDKRLELEQGDYKLFIFGKDFPEREYYLQVGSDTNRTLILQQSKRDATDESSKRAAYARLKWNANLIIESDRETSVKINGEHLNYGFVRENLPSGTYRVEFEFIDGKSYSRFITVQKHRLSYLNHYFLPVENNAKAYSLFPGASQIYKKEYLKGVTALTLTGLAIGLGASNRSTFNTKKSEFYSLQERYRNTTDESLALEFGNRLESMKKDVNRYQTRSNVFFLVAGVVYALNIYDAFQKPKNGYRRTDSTNPFRNLEVNVSDQYLSFSLTMDF